MHGRGNGKVEVTSIQKLWLTVENELPSYWYGHTAGEREKRIKGKRKKANQI